MFVHSEIVSLDEPNFATVKMEMTIGGHEKDDEESNSTSGNKSRSNYTSGKKTVCARADYALQENQRGEKYL